MDVRILIFRLADDRFQASVIDPNYDRIWRKMYPSMRECVTELHRIGLYTITELDAALEEEVQSNDRMLVIQSSAEAEVLEEAGFAEIIPARPN